MSLFSQSSEGNSIIAISQGESTEGQRRDWLATEASAFKWSSTTFGGFGLTEPPFTPTDESIFPESSLVQLLDVFGPRSINLLERRREARAKEEQDGEEKTKKATARAKLIDHVETRVGVEGCEALVERFIECLTDTQFGERKAQERKREILHSIRHPKKKEIVIKYLEKATSFVELDAIDSVIGLALRDDEFETVLQRDLELAREHCEEIAFGVTLSDNLVDKVVQRFHEETSAALQTVLLMVRCAADPHNDMKSEPGWHRFACSFVTRNVESIEDKIFHLLHRDVTSRNESSPMKMTPKQESLLLRILFFLPVKNEMELLARLLKLGPPHISKTAFLARVIQLLSSLQDQYDDTLKQMVQAHRLAAVRLVWSVFAGDVEAFQEYYSAGFDELVPLSKNESFAFVLEPFVVAAMDRFSLYEYLETERDSEFFASLAGAAFRGRKEACEEVWRDVENPIRRLLQAIATYPKAFLELSGALVASPSSAADSLWAHQDEEGIFSSLALFQNLVRFLDKDTLLENFDIMATTRTIIRNHYADPYFIRSLHFLAQKFPQHVLTVIVNEPDKTSFTVLEAITENLENENAVGDYSRNLIPSLELITELLNQVEKEHTSSELRIAFAFASGSRSLDEKQLIESLRILGYTAGIDSSAFQKMSADRLIDYQKFDSLLQSEKGGFFRVLSLSLQNRRTQIEKFVAQAVKIVRELYRSHGGWRFSKIEQCHRIGIQSTRILHACITVPSELESVRTKVTEDIMNDASTQETLINNILSAVGRSRTAQELVFESLNFLLSVLRVDSFEQPKMKLLCRQNLAAGVANYIGFPSDKSCLPCIYPIPKLASKVIESFIFVVQVARSKFPRIQAPSIVALLSHAPNLREDVGRLVDKREISSVSLLTTALEFEPGFAAMLLQKEEIMRSVMDILRDRKNFEYESRLYCAALEFVGVLWLKGFGATIAHLQQIYEDFWKIISHSLFTDVEPVELVPESAEVITKMCYQANIRAWSLEIMTIEMRSSGLRSKKFVDLLASIKNAERDQAWLEQYPALHRVFGEETRLRKIAERTRVNLAKFVVQRPWFSGEQASQSMMFPTTIQDDSTFSLTDRRMRSFGPNYFYNSDLLIRMFADSPDLISEARFSSCLMGLADTELLLLRSWKIYTETRCLLMWEEDSTSLSSPRDGEGVVDLLASPGMPQTPVRTGSIGSDSGSRKGILERTLSSTTSKHWGDATSFVLIVELAKHLRDADSDHFGNSHEQMYLLEVAEMFASMLHFKTFVKLSNPNTLSVRENESGLCDPIVNTGPRPPFCKRSQESRSDRLVLFSEKADTPGIIQLVAWIKSCVNNVLRWSPVKEFSQDILIPLLTGLLMLFEIPEDLPDAGTHAKAMRIARADVLDLTARVLRQFVDVEDIFDLCITLLSLLLAQAETSDTVSLEPLLNHSTLALLVNVFMDYSGRMSRSYKEQQDLCTWLDQQGLSDLRVKVLGSSVAPTSTSGSGSENPASASLPTPTKKPGTILEEDSAPPSESGSDAQKDRDRLKDLARQLGYTGLDFGSRNRTSRNYREFLSKRTFASSNEDGFTEISVIHLLFDFGVTSVAALMSLDQFTMQNMGIYKQSDRRRLLSIIQQKKESGVHHQTNIPAPSNATPSGAGDSNNMNKKSSRQRQLGQAESIAEHGLDTNDVDTQGSSKRQRMSFSRQLGFQKRKEMSQGLLRMQVTLQALHSALRLDKARVGALLAELKVVQHFAVDPLLRVIAGDKPVAGSMGNHDRENRITFRGYSVQGERDPGHLVWCGALRLTSSLLGYCRSTKENWIVDQTLDFLGAHRGCFLSCLSSYDSSDSVFTLAGLEEVNEMVGLLRELAHHTQRWRLQGSLYEPLLCAAWYLVRDLIAGSDTSRRPCLLLEEFVKTFFSPSKAVPKLCIATRPVTSREVSQDRTPLMESFQRKPMPITPRTSSLARSLSMTSDQGLGEETGGNALNRTKARSLSATSNTSMVVSQLAEGDLSLLHVNIEYRVCKIVQQLLVLFRNQQVVKLPGQLELDEQTGQELPTRFWLKAMVPFPLVPRHDLSRYGADIKHDRAGQQSAFGGMKSVDSSQLSPTLETLLSLLFYAQQRLHLCVEGDSSTSPDTGIGSVHSNKWKVMLRFLVTNSLYLLMVSLQLEHHERKRISAETHHASNWPVSTPSTTGGASKSSRGQEVASNFDGVSLLSEETAKFLVKVKSKLGVVLDKYREYFRKLQFNDDELLAVLKLRIDESISRLLQFQAGAALEDGVTDDSNAAMMTVAPPTKNGRGERRSSMQTRTLFLNAKVRAVPASVVIWVPSGKANECDMWEELFRQFNLPDTCFVVPALESVEEGVEMESDREKGIVCWYRNGVPVAGRPQGKDGLRGQVYPVSNLDVLSGLPNAVQVLMNLERAADQPKTDKGISAVLELFALVSAKNENTAETWRMATELAKIVRAEIAHGVAPEHVILGGFQNGGGLALLVSLLLAVEPKPVRLGGVFCVNSHLPLASELAQLLVQVARQKDRTAPVMFPSRVTLLHGARDSVVDSNWAILIKTALEKCGVKVEQSFAMGLGHEDWHIDQMKLLWEMTHALTASSSPST